MICLVLMLPLRLLPKDYWLVSGKAFYLKGRRHLTNNPSDKIAILPVMTVAQRRERTAALASLNSGAH